MAPQALRSGGIATSSDAFRYDSAPNTGAGPPPALAAHLKKLENARLPEQASDSRTLSKNAESTNEAGNLASH